MDVNSQSPIVLAAVYEEYRRYERYLALAFGLGLVTVVSLLCQNPAWPGSMAILAVVAAAFRKYHLVVHRLVGDPGPATDQAVQLWGTAAQACVWGAIPIVCALGVLQFYA
ncbi:hypothetical protein SAMN05421595_2780 [Austwickia chelonae]|uniref:Uncharacterized protein n=1 Tax=Austwickia chelonae NBRC 105200 TaxID=1184607 RepID=K6VP87_9MICO|nr:hypothetical protein [Austwickia chelonae]GAB78509.1 hypothetical protein AUCHE_09_01140 [Austwickia chelonae NBRC 105200]SEW40251.1 hypothetical protein SAMN05421595_2780 [Austwickia chelonae]